MKNNYKVIRQAITKELADFIYSYFLMKRKVARKMYDERYISQSNYDYGVWNDEQIPETYSHYADIAMETSTTKDGRRNRIKTNTYIFICSYL